MTSNGPYYQAIPAPDHQLDKDDFTLSQNLMQYTQSTTYPEPSTDYNQQQQHSSEAAQLHDLVEAATSAAAQERARQEQYAHYPADGAPHHDHVQRIQPELDTHTPLTSAPEDQALEALLRSGGAVGTKRKRSNSPNAQEGAQQQVQSAASTRSKRQKKTAGGRNTDDNGGGTYNALDSPHHLEARAAGVHSAAALFRPASEKSKKYTRPPMSKLFNSLELSPENFLYLQAAAKKFMLDPEHPERQECVGNRDKADHDMVKLKMINTVRTFLKDEGHGEKYFGVNAPPPGEGENGTPGLQRRWVWPRDETKIITLCTPLLRRMLTNERQRQYASDTRKPGRAAKGDMQTEEEHNEPQPEDAQNFPSNPYDQRWGYTTGIQIYMLDGHTGQPVHDRIDMPLDNNVNWDFLSDVIDRHGSTHNSARQTPDGSVGDLAEKFDIKVLASAGLMYVSSENDWRHALEEVHQTIWLEGVVKVIVHVKPPPPAEETPRDQP